MSAKLKLESDADCGVAHKDDEEEKTGVKGETCSRSQQTAV